MASTWVATFKRVDADRPHDEHVRISVEAENMAEADELAGIQFAESELAGEWEFVDLSPVRSEGSAS